MRFFKKVAGFLGFGSHNEPPESNNQDHHHHNNNNNHCNSDDIRRNPMNATGPRKGFSVPVQVPVDRHAVGPVLVPCNGGSGGVQGLRWYATRLTIDEDGDVADEFLYEVSSDMSSIPQDQAKPLSRFQVKQNVKHAKIKNQVMTPDGKLQHCVDCQGQLQWV